MHVHRLGGRQEVQDEVTEPRQPCVRRVPKCRGQKHLVRQGGRCCRLLQLAQ